MAYKALFVGRHQDAQIPGVEIIEQVAVTFATRNDVVAGQLSALAERALQIGANCVILQNTPPQVAATIAAIRTGNFPHDGMFVYAVVNTPGDRPVERATTHFLYAPTKGELEANVGVVVALLTFANPNAKVDVRYTDYAAQPGGLCCEAAITAIVTPPMPFVFHHLERLL